MKYFIIPKCDDVCLTINSKTPEDAMVSFAIKMDSDMNQYFRAVTEKEYEKIESERRARYEREFKIEFFVSELEDGYDLPDEDISQIAERAYEIYCEAGRPPYCDVSTEYDALERAVKEYEDTYEFIEVTYEVTRRVNKRFKITKEEYKRVENNVELPEEVTRELEEAIDTSDCDREDDYEVINGKTGEIVIHWND